MSFSVIPNNNPNLVLVITTLDWTCEVEHKPDIQPIIGWKVDKTGRKANLAVAPIGDWSTSSHRWDGCYHFILDQHTNRWSEPGCSESVSGGLPTLMKRARQLREQESRRQAKRKVVEMVAAADIRGFVLVGQLDTTNEILNSTRRLLPRLSEKRGFIESQALQDLVAAERAEQWVRQDIDELRSRQVCVFTTSHHEMATRVRHIVPVVYAA